MADKKELPLALLEILESSTDKDHILSASQIRKKLESKYGLTLERRTLYSNIELLEKYGHKISSWRDNSEGYYLEERQFKQNEVRSLLNAVNAAAFLSPAESSALTRKILATLSVPQRKLFQEEIYISFKNGRNDAAMSRKFELISDAIRSREAIAFTPLAWTEDLDLAPAKERVLAEPRFIAFFEHRPYLVATLPGKTGTRWFRIDRISDITQEEHTFEALSEETARSVTRSCPLDRDSAQETAVFRCHKSMIDPLTDRFEPFAVFRPLDAEHFELRITASENVILRIAERYATSCVLLEPSHLHERMKEQLAAALNEYNK